MEHPWLVPPAAFNPEGVSWAIKRGPATDTASVAVLYECTTSEPQGIELSKLEVSPTFTKQDAHAWLAGYMPDADAARIAEALAVALEDPQS